MLVWGFGLVMLSIKEIWISEGPLRKVYVVVLCPSMS